MEKAKKIKVCKWSAIAIHCLILFFSLTQSCYTLSDEFRQAWYGQFEQMCGQKLTLLGAGKMLWNWFDYVGDYTSFSNLKMRYTMFLFLYVFIILFLCVEVYEIVELLQNKIGGWSLITGMLAAIIGVTWWGSLESCFGSSVEMTNAVSLNWAILLCGILPWVGVVLAAKARNLAQSEKHDANIPTEMDESSSTK